MVKRSIAGWPDWVQLTGVAKRGIWATRFEGALYNIVVLRDLTEGRGNFLALARQGHGSKTLLEIRNLGINEATALRQEIMKNFVTFVTNEYS
jgi:hypothetical protein